MASADMRVVSKGDPSEVMMVSMAGGRTGNWIASPPRSLDADLGYFRCADAKPCYFFRSQSPGGPGQPVPIRAQREDALMAFRNFSFPPDPNALGTGWNRRCGNE